MSDKPINITVDGHFPIRANMIFDNIGPGNIEDIVWQNVIDTVSEIEQNEIGVGLTQSYQYTKLNKESTIMVKWQGMKTANGNEFRIGLGEGIPGSKMTPTIMKGNFEDGVQVKSTLSIQSVKLGCVNGQFAIERDGKWYAISIGEEIT